MTTTNETWLIINPAENGWLVTRYEKDLRGRVTKEGWVFHEFGAVLFCLYDQLNPTNWVARMDTDNPTLEQVASPDLEEVIVTLAAVRSPETAADGPGYGHQESP
jgi:hypothetical protein